MVLTEGLPMQQPATTIMEPCHIVSGEPYTPRRVVVDDVEITVRDLRDDEAAMAYTWFRQRAESGQGFSLSELGNFSEFRKNILHNQTAFVLEDSLSHQVIYITIIQDATNYKRHGKRDANLVKTLLNPAIARSKTHLAAYKIYFGTMTNISLQQGYRYNLATMTLNNYSSLRNVTRSPMSTILGTIPDGIFLEGHGISDIVIYRIEYQNLQNTGESKMWEFSKCVSFILRYGWDLPK